MNKFDSFFTDEYQSNLRKLSQSKSERFEEVLNIYKESYIGNLLFLSIHEEEETNSELIKYFGEDEISEHLKQVKLDPLLSELIKIYSEWLDGNTIEAVINLEKLLQKHKIFSDTVDVSNKFFFRGRSGENAIYNKYDMFHIPYDKRYLIGNQRYSMSGHPFLYLGSSIINILEELRSDNEKIEDVYFSYFYIDKDKYEVFDLSNPFNSIFKISKSSIKLDKYPKNNFKKMLFKHFLVSICSFEKRNEHEKSKHSKFYEEYVFPQMLTQALRRKKGINGLLYYSTKLNKVSLESNFFKTKFKENVVLFSKHNKKHHYDKTLYDSLKISKPINITNIAEQNLVNIDNMRSILKEIKIIESFRNEEAKNKNNNKVAEIIQRIIQNCEYEYEKLIIIDNKYLNRKCLEENCPAEYCPYGKFEKKIEEEENSINVCYNDLYINSILGRIHLFLMHSFISSEKNGIIFGRVNLNDNS